MSCPQRFEKSRADRVAVATDGPINVEFASGDRLVGTVEVSDDLSASAMQTALGDVTITVGQIISIWPEGTESPELIAVRAEAEAQVEAMRPDWTVTLEAGGSATEGNTDSQAGSHRTRHMDEQPVRWSHGLAVVKPDERWPEAIGRSHRPMAGRCSPGAAA